MIRMASSLAAIDQTERLSYIDALRGLAILGVILVHAGSLSVQEGFFWDLSFAGQRGVQLFYIVSAFTLSHSLDRDRGRSHPYSIFLLRRFFRVAPLFYGTAAGEAQDAKKILPRAINSVAIGGWSIAVESNFYVVLPLIFRRFATLRSLILLLSVTSIAAFSLSIGLAASAPDMLHEQYFAFLWFPVEFPIFILGIIAYRLTGMKQCDGIRRSGPRTLSALLLMVAAFLAWLSFPFSDLTLYSSSTALFLFVMSVYVHPWKIFVNRATQFIGKISYSLYLLHFFTVKFLQVVYDKIETVPQGSFTFLLRQDPWGLPVAYCMIMLISTPICYLSWKFIETPGIELGRAIIRRRF